MNPRCCITNRRAKSIDMYYILYGYYGFQNPGLFQSRNQNWTFWAIFNLLSCNQNSPKCMRFRYTQKLDHGIEIGKWLIRNPGNTIPRWPTLMAIATRYYITIQEPTRPRKGPASKSWSAQVLCFARIFRMNVKNKAIAFMTCCRRGTKATATIACQ